MSIYITRQMIDPAFDTRRHDDGGGLFQRLLRPAIRTWQRRKMIATLNSLDDGTLRDIGINRTDIPRIVDGFSNRELGMEPVASGGPGARNKPKSGLSAVAT